MIKDLDYKGIRQDICDELDVTITDFKHSNNYSVTNILYARIIAYWIVQSYGLTKKECCQVLELSHNSVDNSDRIFTKLSELEDFRHVYAMLKDSCYRKYRKDIHIKNR